MVGFSFERQCGFSCGLARASFRIAEDKFTIWVGLSSGIDTFISFTVGLISDTFCMCGQKAYSLIITCDDSEVSIYMSCIIRSISISSLRARALPSEWSAAFVDTICYCCVITLTFNFPFVLN